MTGTVKAARAGVVALLVVLAAGCTGDSSATSPPAAAPSTSAQPASTAATTGTWLHSRGGCLTSAGGVRAQPQHDGPAVASDFDGDGRSDLAVATGVANEDYDPKYVTELLSGPDGRPRCHAVFFRGPEHSNPPFGTTLATGDFDADGYADLAAGNPQGGRGGQTVTVLYGGRGGLTWDRSTVLRSPRTSFGRAVAVADFDDDGYDDLAISAPHDDGGAPRHRTAADEAIVVAWGGKAPLSMRRSYVIKPPPHPVLWFGEGLAAGDVTGDGYPELFESHGGLPRHGTPTEPVGASETSLILGSPRGPRQLTAVAAAGGGPMTVGDLTGDGIGDLAVGHPCRRESTSGLGRCKASGEVLVFPGSGDGLGAPAHIREHDPAVGGQDGAENYFGAAVQAGRLAHRGVLLVGAPSAHPQKPAGTRLYVVSPGASAGRYPPITGAGLGGVGGDPLQIRDVNGDGRGDVVFPTGQGAASGLGIAVCLGQAHGLAKPRTYWTHHRFSTWA